MAGAVNHLFPAVTFKAIRSGLRTDGGVPTLIVASRKNDRSPVSKRSSRAPRPIIKVSTADGKWRDQWSSELVVSLRQLQLDDLVEDKHQDDNEVKINLSIQKHTGFGFTIDGRVSTSFTRKCRTCYSPYCRDISSDFKVLLLPSNQGKLDDELPEIGGDDSSVIYVTPGCEAELDSVVQDTLRLSTSVMDTCSEACEKSESSIQYSSENKDSASLDKRWSVLLKLKHPNIQPPK